MTGDPDVIGLLQRADWTRLTISATVNDGSTVLVAPPPGSTIEKSPWEERKPNPRGARSLR